MVTFIDGPAGGEGLMLRRAPIYLRVVIGQDGAIDALDQLDDEPNAWEAIHVYRKRPGSGGMVCVRPGGCYEQGRYDHVPDVEGESVRATADWRRWCSERAEAEGLGHTLPPEVRDAA